MRDRLRAFPGEMYLMLQALVTSWPALILAAIFVLAAIIFDCGVALQ